MIHLESWYRESLETYQRSLLEQARSSQDPDKWIEAWVQGQRGDNLSDFPAEELAQGMLGAWNRAPPEMLQWFADEVQQGRVPVSPTTALSA